MNTLQENSLNLIGKIKYVHCKNFVTYTECRFFPSTYLNIVIGPNGTGKSTLVAAMVLGLGGDTKILKRTTQINEYIKNGYDKATIIVQLYNDNEGSVISFERSFDRSGKSEFKIDNNSTSKSNYVKIISTYNIQLDNLCQFLPQDRVQEFSKMNPQEILCNTLQSVKDISIIHDYKELCNLQKTEMQNNHQLLLNTNSLQNLIETKANIEKKLSAYNIIKNLQQELIVCNAKKNWINIRAAKDKLNVVINDRDQAERNFETFNLLYLNLKKEENIINSKNCKLQNNVDEKCASSTKLLKKLINIKEKIDEFQQKIRQSEIDLETSKQTMLTHKSLMLEENKMLILDKHDYGKAVEISGSKEETLVKLEEIENNIKSIETSFVIKKNLRSNILEKSEENNLNSQVIRNNISDLKNVEEQKVKELEKKFPDVIKAVKWLRSNRHIFKGKIYDPIILQINIPNKEHLIYFENLVPARDLLVFICEHKDDVSTLTKELCVKEKLIVNVAYSPPSIECNYKPVIDISHLLKFGFIDYAINLIEAPPAILNYLCSLCNINRIPIGTDRVNENTEDIPIEIKQYFGGDQRFVVSISKYSKERSLMQTYISRNNILTTTDLKLIELKKQELLTIEKDEVSLQTQLKSIESEIENIKLKLSLLTKSKITYLNHVKRLNFLQNNLQSRIHKIEALSRMVDDPDKLEKKYSDIVHVYVKNIFKLHIEEQPIIATYIESFAEKTLAQLNLKIYKYETRDLTNNIHTAHDKVVKSRETISKLENALKEEKRIYNEKLIAAKRCTNNCSPSDDGFPYTEKFAALPDDPDDIDDAINDINARIDCMDPVCSEVIMNYDDICNKIETIQNLTEEKNRSAVDIANQIKEISSVWLKKLDGVIESINHHFSNFMSCMGFAGQIVINRKSENDFESYGVNIMVQYRQKTALQVLDRFVQSGGERSVAIAVYTLALQHLTSVPFRCVDEINQGMDAKNERKIFQLLVQEATQENRAQYFFVTPKLLPDLNFNDKVFVHIVNNGKYVDYKV